MKEVGMARADTLLRQLAQPGRRVIAGVALSRQRVGVGMKEDIAVFGDEHDEQSIDQAQQLAVVILRAQRAGAQLFTEGMIGRMSQEATTQSRDGFLDAVTQLFERTGALLVGGMRPLLQPALGGSFGLHSRLVTEQPQQDKVGIDFAVHHRFKVELNVGLACEAHIVTQDTQLQSIRNDAPHMAFRAVQEFLHKAMRAAACCPGGTSHEVVEIDLETDKVDRCILPAMRDSIALVVDLNSFSSEQATIAQFVEEREQPALSCQRRSQVFLRQFLLCGFESCPRAQQAVPRMVNGLVDLLRLEQVIGFGSQPVQVRVALGNALQQVHRQNRTFTAHGGKNSLLASCIYPCSLVYRHSQHSSLRYGSPSFWRNTICICWAQFVVSNRHHPNATLGISRRGGGGADAG